MARFDLSHPRRPDRDRTLHYGSWDGDQAERYVAQLYAGFQRLADMPPLGRSCNHIRPGLLRAERGSHVVFFRRQPGGDVLICRVLHRHMLPEAQPIDDDDAGWFKAPAPLRQAVLPPKRAVSGRRLHRPGRADRLDCHPTVRQP